MSPHTCHSTYKIFTRPNCNKIPAQKNKGGYEALHVAEELLTIAGERVVSLFFVLFLRMWALRGYHALADGPTSRHTQATVSVCRGENKQTNMKLGSNGEDKGDMKKKTQGVDLPETCLIHVQNYQIIKNKVFLKSRFNCINDLSSSNSATLKSNKEKQ